MALFTSTAVTGQGFGSTIRVYWTNKTNGGSTILSSTNYLANGYMVVWDPTQAGEGGVADGTVVTRPETLLLTQFAGMIVNLPNATTGQSATWIEILPCSTKLVQAYTHVDLTGAAATAVPLCIVNAQFYLATTVALTANAAGQTAVRQYVATAISTGTDTSSTSANNPVRLHGVQSSV